MMTKWKILAKQRPEAGLVSRARPFLPVLVGAAGSAAGEKGSGVSGPQSVTTWNAIIGKVTR